MTMIKPAVLIALLFSSACVSSPSRRSGGASSQPDLDADDTPAHELGRRIVTNSGFNELHQVGQLDFSFVVKDADKTVFEARHRWDIKNGRSRIRWADKAGDRFEAWLDVGTKNAVGTKNGTLVSGAEQAALSAAAYRRYINDTYWLMMPLKLFDPGTTLIAEDKETVDGVLYQILRLSFDDVGLTPGDVYRLYIDDGGFRIHGWQMRLQGRSDRPSYVTWEDYRPVGPLLLSHRHRIEGTARQILIEDAQALRNVRLQVFVPPTESSTSHP